MKTLNDIVRRIFDGRRMCLLGIGPMSDNVLTAAIESALELRYPPMIIASRNQIGVGGGYVNGWNQHDLVRRIREIASETGYDGPLFICRDHGGPWQKDNEYMSKIPLEEAMRLAKESFACDVRAGFNFIHVDPTKDPHSKVDLETVIDRTVELLTFIEAERKSIGTASVEYEVGTEEIHGGLIDADAFEHFIVKLKEKLERNNLPLPVFVVGQTGTLLKMRENVGMFDEDGAKRLCDISRRHGIGFKEHNVDYLREELLRKHPDIGITAANVAPEFGHCETLAYLEAGHACGYSCFETALQDAVLSGTKWKKWVKDSERINIEKIRADSGLKKEVTIVNGHYFFGNPLIKNEHGELARRFKKVIKKSLDRFAIEKIKQSIARYVMVLNLEGFNVPYRESEKIPRP